MADRFGLLGLVGLGSHLGMVGASGLARIYRRFELEAGVGYSLVSKWNFAAQARYVSTQRFNSRHSFTLGYTLSIEDRSISSQEWNWFYGVHQKQRIYDEPGLYKTHWINVGWGMEFRIDDVIPNFCFLVGYSRGFGETTAGGQIWEDKERTFQRKNGYVFNREALALVPFCFIKRF